MSAHRASLCLLATVALAACSTPQPVGDAAANDGAQTAPDSTVAPTDSSGPLPDASAVADSATPTGRTVPVGRCGARRGRYFPEGSWVYTDVTSAPTRANSEATTAWLERAGGWGNANRFQLDTSFVINEANASTRRVARSTADPIEYSADCDPNVMFPLPAGGRIEGHVDYVCPARAGGDINEDCHLIVVDFEANHLFEGYAVTFEQDRLFSNCSVRWDMTRDVWGAPPTGASLPPVAARNWGIGRDCTGPDAAGFPMAPLLITIGDVMSGRVEHPIRFALPNNRMQRAAAAGQTGPVYVWPATHAGGPTQLDPNAPIYGSRWRLRASFDPSARGLDPANPVVRAVVYGLQHYGMLLADGGEIALMAEDSTGCAASWDSLWGDRGSRVLNGIRPSDFEIIDTGATEAGWDCARNASR
jgi:hypothetical protein